MKFKRVLRRAIVLALGGAGLFCVFNVSTVYGQATTLRVVNWNIEADVASTDNGLGTFAGTGASGGGIAPITTVLSAIGSLNLAEGTGSISRPIDVLALEEVGANTAVTGNNTLSSPSTTQLSAIVTALNNIYGANTYAYSTAQNYTSGGEGGGPSAMIYNTKTVSIVSATNIGTAYGYSSPPGPFRAPLQFQIQPLGYSTAAQFYVDVSHAKSGTTTDDAADRNAEAQEIVASTPVTSGAHVLSVGDFNLDGGATEATYQTMITKFNDPGDPDKSWTDSSSKYYYLESEEGYDVRYRDDIQFASASATDGVSPGLQYDANSYTVLGNLGSIHGANVNTQTGTYSFAGLTTPQNVTENSSLLQALGGTTIGATNDNSDTAASDHLPIVADYDIYGFSTPEPTSATILLAGLFALGRRRRK